MKIIRIENLCKNYDTIKAVDNISFEVEEGSLFAFLGKNGAGKSTTINIIATLLEKTEGSVYIDNLEVGKDDEKIKNIIGVVFQESILDKELTVYENLVIRGSMYKLSKGEIVRKINQLVEIFDLKEILSQKYGTLSGGQRRLVDVTKALINTPKVLILDEPTTGLDPKIRLKLWDALNKLRETTGLTIFLTTHYMEETKNADEVVIINKGKIVAKGTPSELKNEYSKSYVKFTLKDGLDNKFLANYKYLQNTNEITIAFNNSFESLEFINGIKDRILTFEIYNGDMDDVFLNVNGEV